jgi:hypothetical protein
MTASSSSLSSTLEAVELSSESVSQAVNRDVDMLTDAGTYTSSFPCSPCCF